MLTYVHSDIISLFIDSTEYSHPFYLFADFFPNNQCKDIFNGLVDGNYFLQAEGCCREIENIQLLV